MQRFVALVLASLPAAGIGEQALAAPPFFFAPNDGRDDTAGVQYYLDQLARPEIRDRPPLPPGRLLISDTLRIKKTMGYRLAGSGGQNRSSTPGWNARRVATVLVWNGPPDKPMLELAGCSGMVIEGVNFDGPASIGILIRDAEGSLNIAIRDCAFSGQDVGIQCGTEFNEKTCANITYDNCHFHDNSEACVRIVNSQSLEHLFLRPQFNRSAVAIDVQAGGDVTVVGGGTYELQTLLKLGRVAVNTRGFDVQSVRFDGQSTRTTWLDFAQIERARDYGTITFANCSQNNGQQENQQPLATVAPGSRVVLRECSFAGGPLIGGNLAHIHANRRAGGELVVVNCDGLNGQTLPDYVQTYGDRAHYTFVRCGNLMTETGSATNFHAGGLSPAELAALRRLAQLSEDDLLKVLRAVEQSASEEAE